MSRAEHEPFEERRKRYIREHEDDLQKEMRRQQIPWPKDDPQGNDQRHPRRREP